MKVSVVVPTYNRSALLRRTLDALTRQQLPAYDFEVIVADDGSSDSTLAVVRSYVDRLNVDYHFQEDRGFRAAAARNAGARMAQGEVLVFLDTGAVVGPAYLNQHYAAHQAARPLVVLGYAYGFNPDIPPLPGLAGALATQPPEQVLARFTNESDFLDVRHGDFARCDFDLTRRAVPWMLLFTINCSMRRDEFWRVGGFDESFHGWGVEDLEFGYRLHRAGVTYQVSRDAWVIESPHPRDMAANLVEFRRNAYQFVARHPQPPIEIGWALITGDGFWRWEDECRHLTEVSRRARDVDVTGEIGRAVRDVPPGERIAVFGCGGKLPPSLPPAAVFDFDEELLRRALAVGCHTGHHALGLRTCLTDAAVDTVLVTSRLAPLWDRWGGAIEAEAHRLGRTVRRTG